MKNLILMSDGFTEESLKNDEISGLLKRVAEGKKSYDIRKCNFGRF